jgi:crotonobetainyl-CoA:carnitine CoA-transferase CaiB-like acyl-CoA transferase
MLNGIRVVDFTRYLPGPFATLRLAEMGAEVIKVEPPGTGDPARVMGEQLNGTGLVYLANNRKKKSVTVNLKEQEGQQIAYQLACQADVVIEGFRPGVADAMGISYDKLKQLRPDIVYCSLSGYGQTGPLRELGGHDLNYMSWSGVLSQLKDLAERPVQPGMQFADLIGGIAAAEAILAALVKKGLTGKGSYLDISMTDALRGMMNSHMMLHRHTGSGTGLRALGGSIICYHLYETSDGRFISIGALEQKFWDNFCQAVGRQEWVGYQYSPASADNPIFMEVSKLFKTHTLAEWSKFALEVDCCVAPVLEIAEIANLSHVMDKGLLTESETELAPELGQHNREVFQNLLGVSQQQIKEWQRRGTI